MDFCKLGIGLGLEMLVEGLFSFELGFEFFVFGFEIVELIVELMGFGGDFLVDLLFFLSFEFLDLVGEFVDLEFGGRVVFVDLFFELLVG